MPSGFWMYCTTAWWPRYIAYFRFEDETTFAARPEAFLVAWNVDVSIRNWASQLTPIWMTSQQPAIIRKHRWSFVAVQRTAIWQIVVLLSFPRSSFIIDLLWRWHAFWIRRGNGSCVGTGWRFICRLLVGFRCGSGRRWLIILLVVHKSFFDKHLAALKSWYSNGGNADRIGQK